MTLAEFFALHRAPRAIVLPRRVIRMGGSRRLHNAIPGPVSQTAAAESASGTALSALVADDAAKKH